MHTGPTTRKRSRQVAASLRTKLPSQIRDGEDYEVLPNDSGQMEEYSGPKKRAARHGYGKTDVLQTRERYEGQFLANAKTGLGMWRLPSGEVYDGEWENDYRNGVGCWRGATGDQYGGTWHKDMMSGYGIYVAAGTSYVFKGHYNKNGWEHGPGLLVSLDSGTGYHGEWLHGDRHGKGIEFDLRADTEWNVVYHKGNITQNDPERPLDERRLDQLNSVDYFRRLPDGTILHGFLAAASDVQQRIDQLLTMDRGGPRIKRQLHQLLHSSAPEAKSPETKDEDDEDPETHGPSRYHIPKGRFVLYKVQCNKAFRDGVLMCAGTKPDQAHVALLDNRWTSAQNYLQPAGFSSNNTYVIEYNQKAHSIMAERTPAPGRLFLAEIGQWFQQAQMNPAFKDLRFHGIWLDFCCVFDTAKKAIVQVLESQLLADDCFFGVTLIRRTRTNSAGKTPFNAMCLVQEVAQRIGYRAELHAESCLVQGLATVFWRLRKV